MSRVPLPSCQRCYDNDRGQDEPRAAPPRRLHPSLHLLSSEDQARRVQQRGKEARLYCHISTIYLHCCPARHVHTRATQIYHKEWIKTPSGRLSGPFTQIDFFPSFKMEIWPDNCQNKIISLQIISHSPAIQQLLCGLISSRKNNNKNVVEQNVCKATRISRTVQTCLQTPGNLQDLRFAAKIHSESEPSTAAAERITTITKEESQTSNVQMCKMTSEREAQAWKMSPVSVHLSPKLAATGGSYCDAWWYRNVSVPAKMRENRINWGISSSVNWKMKILKGPNKGWNLGRSVHVWGTRGREHLVLAVGFGAKMEN